MIIKFFAKGHANMLIEHKNTFEITKDDQVSLQGDCIVACNSDFDKDDILQFVNETNDFKITLECKGVKEEITASINKGFDDDRELVFRFGSHQSTRTLGLNASKTAKYFSNEFRKAAQGENKIEITLESL